MSGSSEDKMEVKKKKIWHWFGNREGKGRQAHQGGGLQVMVRDSILSRRRIGGSLLQDSLNQARCYWR